MIQAIQNAPGLVPWFKRWFDSSYYHKLYGNRDEKEAAGFINELISCLQPATGSTMLDVGCGAGRHCKQLAAKGYHVTGIDLASSSIREAKQFQSDSLHFFRHDMRVPFGKNSFDYVFSFFTSFGYFKEQDQNNKVVNNMSNAVKPGGMLVLDYINVRYSEDHLIEMETKEIDGITLTITRWMDQKNFFKKIVIGDQQLENPLEYVEQVAKFDLVDFYVMFSRCKLQIQEVYGDYSLSAYDPKTSPRLVMIAKKSV